MAPPRSDGPDAWSSTLGTFELARGPGGAVGAKTAFAETADRRRQEHPLREVHDPVEPQRRHVPDHRW